VTRRGLRRDEFNLAGHQYGSENFRVLAVLEMITTSVALKRSMSQLALQEAVAPANLRDPPAKHKHSCRNL